MPRLRTADYSTEFSSSICCCSCGGSDEGAESTTMQLHFSPSMRSITISSNSENGFSNDLMKIKVAPPHISYRTLFHTILILAFLLPFVFILTAVVTLEGVNKCSSFGCLGRRFGPRFLGRVDNSGVINIAIPSIHM
ncbi:hypothetical protein C3L33_01479, partial [Rhododendron williamsianum]